MLQYPSKTRIPLHRVTSHDRNFINYNITFLPVLEWIEGISVLDVLLPLAVLRQGRRALDLAVARGAAESSLHAALDALLAVGQGDG